MSPTTPRYFVQVFSINRAAVPGTGTRPYPAGLAVGWALALARPALRGASLTPLTARTTTYVRGTRPTGLRQGVRPTGRRRVRRSLAGTRGNVPPLRLSLSPVPIRQSQPPGGCGAGNILRSGQDREGSRREKMIRRRQTPRDFNGTACAWQAHTHIACVPYPWLDAWIRFQRIGNRNCRCGSFVL
jgi:hypothetical protein